MLSRHFTVLAAIKYVSTLRNRQKETLILTRHQLRRGYKYRQTENLHTHQKKMVIKMLDSFFKPLEDPARPLLGPNIWILDKFWLVLPDNAILSFGCRFLHLAVLFFVLTQCAELYLKRTDMAEVFTNLRILMLSFVCAVKGNTFLFWQRDWMRVIEYVTAADKAERDTRDDIKSVILDKYTRYCRRITFFYWMLVFATLIGTTTAPYVFLSSLAFREGLRNGTEVFPHVFSSWMPFDKYTFPGNWITVAWHTFMCTIGAGILVSYDTTIIAIMVFFGGKLELLKEHCKKIVCDDDGIFMSTIAEIHGIHVLLLEYTKLFNSLLSPVMFVYVVMCSLMICMSAIQMAMTTSATHMLIMAEYLVFGVAQLFMICWHSNEVRVKFDEVSGGPYECAWQQCGARRRRDVARLTAQLRRARVFTAGPFTDLTIPTFITILKGAYSYYTLLRK